MISRSQIKQIKSLHRRKGREEHQLFIVEGKRAVEDIWQSGMELVHLYLSNDYEGAVDFISEDFPVSYIHSREMKSISTLKSPPGILAVVKISGQKTANPREERFIILDGLSDPGNIGTIIRAAHWFGYETIYCSPDTVDVYNPKVIQATMGSIGKIKVLYTDLEKLIDRLKPQIKTAALAMDGESINNISFSGEAVALVIGNEANGVSPSVMKKVDLKLTIPPADNKNKPESLNASVAASIAMFAMQLGN